MLCVCPVSSEELEELLVENEAVVLRSIAEELRSGLPVEAMLVSERLALQKVGGARTSPRRGLKAQLWSHVDATQGRSRTR